MAVNPHFLSEMDETPTNQIRDDLDFPHSGIFKALHLAAKGTYVIKESATDFDIAQSDGGSFTSLAIKGGAGFRHGKYVQIGSGSGTTTTILLDTSVAEGGYTTDGTSVTANQDVTPVSSDVYLMVVADSSNAIKIRGRNADTNKIPMLISASDIPIAVIKMTASSADDATDRPIQYLTTDQDDNSVSIGYASSTNYIESMAITGDANKTIFKSKIANSNVRFILADNTADEKFEIYTDDDSDGDDGDTSIFSIDGVKTLTCGALSYDQEDLLLVSAAAQIQVKDTTNNYAVTIKGGGGPRIQFGDTDSSVDSFMDMGSYSSINNIDTQNRDFKIWGANSSNHIYIDESESRVGINQGTPLQTLDVNGSLALKTITYTGSSHSLAATDCVIIGNSGTNPSTITLPAAGSHLGRVLIFKNIHASNAIAISRAGSDTIEHIPGALGQTLVAVASGESLNLISDGGAKWINIAWVHS
jgi:hypothetical protein